MSRTSPGETFVEARSAVERGDWETLFACLDRNDLLKIAGNSIQGLLGRQESDAVRLTALCAEHSFAEETILELRTLDQRMAESAREMWSSDPAGSTAEMGARSRRHREIVVERDKLLKSGLRSTPDLPRFAAALERAMRAALGGGSVSSRLFVGEELEDLSVAGTKAWATRRTSRGLTEDIGFVQRKGQWYIRLTARRPRP
jgi:hypothetical protein